MTARGKQRLSLGLGQLHMFKRVVTKHSKL